MAGMVPAPPAATAAGALAKGEGVGGEAGREAQLEHTVAERLTGDERVEPVAADPHASRLPSVEAPLDGAFATEDEVDVPGMNVETETRAKARDRALRSDHPDTPERERVLGKPRRQGVRLRDVASYRRAGVACRIEPRVPQIRLRCDRERRRRVCPRAGAPPAGRSAALAERLPALAGR